LGAVPKIFFRFRKCTTATIPSGTQPGAAVVVVTTGMKIRILPLTQSDQDRERERGPESDKINKIKMILIVSFFQYLKEFCCRCRQVLELGS